MPKYKKIQEQKKQELEEQKTQVAYIKQKMFTSAGYTYLLAIIPLVLSLLLNGRFVVIPNPDASTAITVVDVLLKALTIITFFFFAFVSFANYMELCGYIMDLKYIIILLVISLLQSSTELYVFLASLGGIAIVLVYLYFIQAKAG